MDFGLARMMGTEHLTNDGFMVGTPAYMAPEQVLGKEIDGRADVYAMGVVLYRLLTSQLPFHAESGIAMVQKQINDQPTPVQQIRGDLPDAASEILERALAKAPEARFQTADDFRDALLAMAGMTTSATMLVTSAIADARLVQAAALEQPTPSVIPQVQQPPPQTQAQTPASSPTMVLPRSQANPPAAARPFPVRPVAIAAAALVILAAIPATILIARHRARTGADLAVPPAAAAASVPVPAAAPVSLPPGKTSSSTVAAAHLEAVPPPKHAAAPASSPAPSIAPDSAASVVPAADRSGERLSAAARANVPIMMFQGVKFLVVDGGKTRDQDATLRLGVDRVEVLDGDTPLRAVRYSDVIAVFHSHSRDPEWTGADGKSVPLVKASGRFQFLKGPSDWITVKTRNSFVSLRVDESELAQVIGGLEARTGTHIVQTR
jgi:serine/threonine-protein kinase